MARVLSEEPYLLELLCTFCNGMFSKRLKKRHLKVSHLSLQVILKMEGVLIYGSMEATMNYWD